MKKVEKEEPDVFEVRTTGQFRPIQPYDTSRQVRGIERKTLRSTTKFEKAKKNYLDYFTAVNGN
jgi:hypothetical protein